MILPAVTRPWREAISPRLHAPRASKAVLGFQSYRPCLRWEFGFSCAFCLVHEHDLAPYGVEGSGLTHVEHFFLQSRDEGKRNLYANCFYACRFCNVSRGETPNVDPYGRSLLEPCETAWPEGFTISRDRIHPRSEPDGNAAYTCATYELNDPRKLRMRRLRRLTIRDRVSFLKRTRSIEADLLDDAARGGGSEYSELAQAITDARRRAHMDLLRFRPVPEDRDWPCSCHRVKRPRLPAVLQEQLIDLGELRRPPRRARGRSDHN